MLTHRVPRAQAKNGCYAKTKKTMQKRLLVRAPSPRPRLHRHPSRASAVAVASAFGRHRRLAAGPRPRRPGPRCCRCRHHCPHRCRRRIAAAASPRAALTAAAIAIVPPSTPCAACAGYNMFLARARACGALFFAFTVAIFCVFWPHFSRPSAFVLFCAQSGRLFNTCSSPPWPTRCIIVTYTVYMWVCRGVQALHLLYE